MDEVDPLDAYMQLNEQQLKKEEGVLKKAHPFLLNEEEEEVYHEYHPSTLAQSEEKSGQIEYDENDIPIQSKKIIKDVLSPIDHTKMDYKPFNKNIYHQHIDVASLSAESIKMIREENAISIENGNSNPIFNPIQEFEHANLNERLLDIIEFPSPTPVQMQTLPIALSGHDMIVISGTGTGHLSNAGRTAIKPSALILSPTRELANQIYTVLQKLAKSFRFKVEPVFGGVRNKYAQTTKMAGEPPDILIATPGRLIDYISLECISISYLTFCVIDEVDKLLSMGFERQIRMILNQIRPDKQLLVFSATIKPMTQKLLNRYLKKPFKVIIGKANKIQATIQQYCHVLNDPNAKLDWLITFLYNNALFDKKILIFSNTKSSCEGLEHRLKKDFKVGVMHGGVDQVIRLDLMYKYRKGDINILIGTDVAARGLDIPDLKIIINYDCPKNIEFHIHRIGRVGRAGALDGVAHTLLLPSDAIFAGELVNSFDEMKIPVSPDLVRIANSNPHFRRRNPISNKTSKYNKPIDMSIPSIDYSFLKSANDINEIDIPDIEAQEAKRDRKLEARKGLNIFLRESSSTMEIDGAVKKRSRWGA